MSKYTDTDKRFDEKCPIVHSECEDPWYSCPLSEEGCVDERSTGCTCGATREHENFKSFLHQELDRQREAILKRIKIMGDEGGDCLDKYVIKDVVNILEEFLDSQTK